MENTNTLTTGNFMMDLATANPAIAEDMAAVRYLTIDGQFWFVGKDVATRLGYKNTKKALGDHVDPEDRIFCDGVTFRDRLGRKQKPVLINESGFYSLVMDSRLPGAKKFKRWITSEVLPSIRKNGGYITGQETLSETELMKKAIEVVRNTFNCPLDCLEELGKM